MRWFWRFIAQYLRATVTVELVGITEDTLRETLHSEAMERLKEVEGILFSEEIPDEEKLSVLQSRFLAE